MSLEKLRIEKEDPGSVFADMDGFANVFELFKPPPLFNPSEIKISKDVQWNISSTKDSNVGQTSFGGGKPATFSITLFFDAYEGVRSLWDFLPKLSDPLAAYSYSSPDAVDVRTNYTDKIVKLLDIDGSLGRPPMCRLHWGEFGLIFQGYLVHLDQRFVLFMPDGTPVRAYLDCVFKEYLSPEEDKKKQNRTSAIEDDPTRIVKLGDTLSSIAAEEYNDPKLWRPIARENGLNNPRDLKSGMVLTIPVLSSSDLQRR